jgi:hypothetical protein
MSKSHSEMKVTFTISGTASLDALTIGGLQVQALDTQRGRHDHHSIHATNLTRNSPKKWTETPWLEGTQSALRSRVSLAGISTSDQVQDLVTTLSIAAQAGSSGPFKAGSRSRKIPQWHPICSKSNLLPIDARTGLRTFRAGVGRSLPRMQTRQGNDSAVASRLVSQTSVKF